MDKYLKKKWKKNKLYYLAKATKIIKSEKPI